MSAEAGRKAVEALDHVLSKRPKPDGEAFTQTTMCLAQFREDMIAREHGEDSPGAEQRLSRLNAVIAVVLGGHFPVGDVPWDELEKAKGWLEQLVEEAEAAA